MAEVFGAVASGIGIAGVAAQAIDGIRKLQTFCNDVRDAPEEITYMTNELEILLGTIAGIEAQIQRNASICQTLNPTSALRFVAQSVNSLNAVIQKLNVEIARKRKLDSIRTAWKKKVLEAHMAKIERSKTSLGLAVSAYSTELYLQTTMRTDTQIEQLSMDVTTLTTLCQAQLITVPGPLVDGHQQIGYDQSGRTVDNEKHDRNIRKRPTSSRTIPILSFSLMVPRWLMQYSLQISVCRAAQSWTLNLKPYRTVPGNKELWYAIGKGDFNTFRDLIDSKQVNVFDRNEYGWTPLHVLAIHASLDYPEAFMRMARFLIERGANVDEPDNTGTSATYHLVNSSASPILGYDLWHLDLFKVFVDESNLDSELFWENYSRSVSKPPTPVCEDKLERIFPLDTTEYPRFTTAERLQFVVSGRQRYISPRDLAVYLNIESLEAAYPAFEDKMKYDLLRVALNQWAYSLGWLGEETLVEEWEGAFRALFAAGAQLEVLCSQETEEKPDERFAKPKARVLLEVIRHFVRPYAWHKTDHHGGLVDARDTLKGLRHLTSRIRYLGMELETIQPRERLDICFDEKFMRSSGDFVTGDPCIDPHTLSLYYDGGSSAWMLWCSTYENYCGEFWDLLEHPAMMLPGTWVD